MDTKRFTTWNAPGQALIEFIIGLIGVIALFAGLLQIASLSRAHTDAMTEARREAAVNAMGAAAFLSTPDYIQDVVVGPDESHYSADDSFTVGSHATFLSTVLEPSAPTAAEWAIIDAAPNNQFTVMRDSFLPAYEMQMVKGDDSRDVDVIPAVQHLIYDTPTIEVKARVWLPWTGGIY